MQVGLCRARSNQGGAVLSDNYGLITAIGLDPIEKKPLRRFYPGSLILSVGSYGCNMHCSFCQNYRISASTADHVDTVFFSPEDLVEKASELKDEGNIGIAFTYNEPLVGYEYVKDCARLAQEWDLKTVVVTNGYINEDPLVDLLPDIDAMNIDLKSFSPVFYQRCGGGLEEVKRSIRLASESCHVEVTTLIIPNENDSEEEIGALSAWLATVDDEIPLHISRFFPQYRMNDREPTDVSVVYRLAEIAREHLKYVYEGNC
jgi:pyruvate formate lyase activating enzyme